MKRIEVQVCIELTIDDEQEFRQAAHDRALEEGLPESEAKDYLDPEVYSLAECGQMLLDPAISPAGCTIQQSSAEQL